MKPTRLYHFVTIVTSLFGKGRSPTWQRVVFAILVVLVPSTSMAIVYGISHKPAKAAVTTIANDTLRTGWYPDQPNLSISQVGSGTFGQMFSTNINGQVYAQPLVSQGTLFVATETNNIYGLDPATGAQKWTRNLGVPFNPSDLTCSDLTPSIGITSTPVIDSATNIAYFTSKTYLNGTSGSAATFMHAVDVATGTEQSGFPVQIQGTAANDPTHTFDGTHQLQRPGLLLMNGVVYAAFGAHCDRKPYEGWVVGISTSGQITTLWTDEVGMPQSSFPGAGIWESGGGLLSDGPGQIIIASGNGFVPPFPSLGNSVPNSLGQSVARLSVQPDGSLKATDFFSPYDSDQLNSTDSDLGAGAPVALPPQYFGTATYPHLLVEVGKQGYVYLLDANNLGGRGEGPNNSDAVINRIGPNGGVWGKPSVWPGDGGYVYITTAQGGGGSGKLKAYRYGLDGSGKPTLSLVATTSDAFGFGSSSPIVTSSNTTSGSALVWVVWAPDGTGVGGQLRAYDPIPVNGVLQMRFSAPIGTASKFNSPVVDNGRVYVGTRDGRLLCFGSPVNTPLSGSPLAFPTTVLGQSATTTATLTANTDLTVNAVASSNSVFTIGSSTPALPATLAAGQTINVPVTFTPTNVGLAAGNLNVTTSSGSVIFELSGTGESSTGQITVSPPTISFGGVTAGGDPASVSTTFSNTGATPVTVNYVTLPAAPFSVSGMPAIGTLIAPNTSITVTLTFAPTTVGQYSDTLIMGTSTGEVDVPMSGTAGTPPKLQVTPLSTNLGNVSIGANGTASFNMTNTGGSPLNITLSKSPVAGVGFTAFTSLPEGTMIAPGASLAETVLFAPTASGTVSDTWVFNSNDSSGQQIVTFTGTGVPRVPGILPSLYISETTVQQPVTGTTVANFTVTLGATSASPVTVNYTTKDGTATVASGDYVTASGTLTFNPGETTKTIPVTVNGNGGHGANETFSLNLSKPTNAVLGDASAKARLVKPLGPYSIAVGDVSVNASSTGTVTANFPVSLSAQPIPGETVTVNVATADGTAKVAAGDYVALPSTTLTFTNTGSLVQNVAVTVNPANSGAGNKTFVLNLSSASSNASIADAQAVATIVNGGPTPLPSVYITDTTVTQPTTGNTSATFTLTLSAPSTVPVTVNYATHDSSATVVDGDYVPTSGTVTFNPGDTVKTVSVTVNSDTFREVDEYFYLNLTKPTKAVLGDVAGRGTVISQLGRYFVYVGDASVVQNATAGSVVMVPVSLSAAPAYGESVTVQVSTSDGTAVSGSNADYTALPQTTITFSGGQQTVLVPVFINPDPTVKGPKTFTFLLGTSSSNAIVSDTSATVTIINHG